MFSWKYWFHIQDFQKEKTDGSATNVGATIFKVFDVQVFEISHIVFFRKRLERFLEPLEVIWRLKKYRCLIGESWTRPKT